jgi:hypothetical protein
MAVRARRDEYAQGRWGPYRSRPHPTKGVVELSSPLLTTPPLGLPWLAVAAVGVEILDRTRPHGNATFKMEPSAISLRVWSLFLLRPAPQMDDQRSQGHQG